MARFKENDTFLCKSKELGLLQHHKFQSFSSSSPQRHDNLKRKEKIELQFCLKYWNVFRASAYVGTRCHESRGRISMNGICVAVTSGQQHGAHSYRAMENENNISGTNNITHQITTMEAQNRVTSRPHS